VEVGRVGGNEPLCMGCQAVAIPLGARAANTVLHRSADRSPAAVSQAFVGHNVSFEPRRATIQLLYRDDHTPRRTYLGGKPAASAKKFFCASTAKSIIKEAPKPGAIPSA
jgi:NADH dehydrogenase